MQYCIPIEELMLCCVFFSIIRIKLYFFYLAFTHLPKFKRGQRQTPVILLAINLKKKYIFNEFLTNSPGTNLTYLALLDNLSWAPSFFLIRTPLMQNKVVQK